MTNDKKVAIGFVVMIVLAILLIISGCSPKVVTVPEYHYEKLKTADTIIQKDSIFSEKNTIIREADSTMLSELGIRLQQGERAILVLRKELEKALSRQKEVIRDTVIKADSIRVPYPVEKELSWWQKQKIRWGEIAMVIMAVILFLAFTRKK